MRLAPRRTIGIARAVRMGAGARAAAFVRKQTCRELADTVVRLLLVRDCRSERSLLDGLLSALARAASRASRATPSVGGGSLKPSACAHDRDRAAASRLRASGSPNAFADVAEERCVNVGECSLLPDISWAVARPCNQHSKASVTHMTAR